MRKCFPILLLAFAACQQPAEEPVKPATSLQETAQVDTPDAPVVKQQQANAEVVPLKSKKKQPLKQLPTPTVELPPLTKATSSKHFKPDNPSLQQGLPRSVSEPAPATSGGAVYEEDYIPFIKQFW